ncbi:hypothetical protein FGIG_03187 [Fasciola gigantica]|uniref:Peptidase A2 domain-containing protein n=1 Tax=Fasciola gigantica TaxID=46835 RepID=A0A504YTR1_FASGI|nr:hypothetical protein FGIG_03187 [Fasciola gigantica]
MFKICAKTKQQRIPHTEAFSPATDFLWAVREPTHLQTPPIEHLACIFCAAGDHAARQVLATGPHPFGPRYNLAALEELFAQYELAPAFLEKFLERRQHLAESVDEYAACLRVLATKAYPKASKDVRDEHILGRFTMGISDPQTKEDFLLNMPTSLQSALLRARKLEACREALRQLPNETIAAIQPAVFKPQPSRTPSASYPGPQPYCRYFRKFGSRAQHCGHNPAVQYTGESQYRAMSLPFVSLNNNDWQSPLVVEGLLNGKGAKLLIDTGASCSVINRSLTKISRSVPLNGRLIAANGTVMPILGQVAGSVSIGRCTVQHQFLCADVAWDAILGMDFLRAHRIVIDFDRQLLVINERPEPIGQSIAALKLDNSWISEMLLGAIPDQFGVRRRLYGRTEECTSNDPLYLVITKRQAAKRLNHPNQMRTSKDDASVWARDKLFIMTAGTALPESAGR